MRDQTLNVLLKVIVCGECRVGKTLFCHRLTTNDSDEIGHERFIRRTGSVGFSAVPYEPTIGLDMAVIKRRLSQSTVAKVHLWDTSGDPRFLGIVRSYYKACCAAVIIVDATDRHALRATKKWVDDLRGQRRDDGRSLIIGVFADVGNGVHPSNGELVKYCEKKRIYYAEMKLRQNKNVESSFGMLLSMVYDAYISQGIEVSGVGVLNGGDLANGVHPLIDGHHAPQKPRCCTIL